jgi:hypothetical protein
LLARIPWSPPFAPPAPPALPGPDLHRLIAPALAWRLPSTINREAIGQIAIGAALQPHAYAITAFADVANYASTWMV